jgi:CheY-like chemotaxis protein/nitrogen-specific signal transduction histidine kinase
MTERSNADLGRILVIDDNPRNVLLIRVQLEREGYLVDSAQTGPEGLDSALALPPDLILLDIMMPGLDGYQVCQLLRENESTSAVPVIVLTSLNERADKLQAFNCGADDFLSKPVDRAELLSRVSSLLRMRRLYEERGRFKEQLERKQAETATLEAAIKTERALRASEERFRKQYKGFPLPTYSWLQANDDFVLQDFNDAAEAITDVGIRDSLGIRASELYAKGSEVLVNLHACVAEQRTLRREMRYRYRTTGLERELAVTYVFVAPRTVMAHVEDITEAKQAEQQREAMAQSEKLRALGQMATGIAHDLNQSLMLVASYTDLARQALVHDPPDLADLADLLMTTSQAALDGGETVKRLLLFTRAAPEPKTQAVDLGDILRDAARLTAPRWRDAAQAEGRPIDLQIEVDGTPTVQGSRAQLRELMTNLIFNAVDALPTGGAIRLKVVVEGGQAIIDVADSGVGMSAEVQERVFEPFFTTKGEAGTGLGLAMVFRIVEQHGGHIEVRSVPGEGTTFSITFPVVEVSAEAESPPKPVLQLEPPRALRILIVDDEPMMTKAVARMLQPSGHVVSVAGSGEEALEKLAEQTFDVVVSDVGMGTGMNGWELAQEVKCRWPGLRFLLATGWGAALDPGEARTRGVEAVLNKPYQLADLLQALARNDQAA